MVPLQTDWIVSFGKDAQHLAGFALVDIAECERDNFWSDYFVEFKMFKNLNFVETDAERMGRVERCYVMY